MQRLSETLTNYEEGCISNETKRIDITPSLSSFLNSIQFDESNRKLNQTTLKIFQRYPQHAVSLLTYATKLTQTSITSNNESLRIAKHPPPPPFLNTNAPSTSVVNRLHEEKGLQEGCVGAPPTHQQPNINTLMSLLFRYNLPRIQQYHQFIEAAIHIKLSATSHLLGVNKKQELLPLYSNFYKTNTARLLKSEKLNWSQLNQIVYATNVLKFGDEDAEELIYNQQRRLLSTASMCGGITTLFRIAFTFPKSSLMDLHLRQEVYNAKITDGDALQLCGMALQNCTNDSELSDICWSYAASSLNNLNNLTAIDFSNYSDALLCMPSLSNDNKFSRLRDAQLMHLWPHILKHHSNILTKQFCVLCWFYFKCNYTVEAAAHETNKGMRVGCDGRFDANFEVFADAITSKFATLRLSHLALLLDAVYPILIPTMPLYNAGGSIELKERGAVFECLRQIYSMFPKSTEAIDSLKADIKQLTWMESLHVFVAFTVFNRTLWRNLFETHFVDSFKECPQQISTTHLIRLIHAAKKLPKDSTVNHFIRSYFTEYSKDIFLIPGDVLSIYSHLISLVRWDAKDIQLSSTKLLNNIKLTSQVDASARVLKDVFLIHGSMTSPTSQKMIRAAITSGLSVVSFISKADALQLLRSIVHSPSLTAEFAAYRGHKKYSPNGVFIHTIATSLLKYRVNFKDISLIWEVLEKTNSFNDVLIYQLINKVKDVLTTLQPEEAVMLLQLMASSRIYVEDVLIALMDIYHKSIYKQTVDFNQFCKVLTSISQLGNPLKGYFDLCMKSTNFNISDVTLDNKISLLKSAALLNGEASILTTLLSSVCDSCLNDEIEYSRLDASQLLDIYFAYLYATSTNMISKQKLRLSDKSIQFITKGKPYLHWKREQLRKKYSFHSSALHKEVMELPKTTLGCTISSEMLNELFCNFVVHQTSNQQISKQSIAALLIPQHDIARYWVPIKSENTSNQLSELIIFGDSLSHLRLLRQLGYPIYPLIDEKNCIHEMLKFVKKQFIHTSN